MKKTKTHVYFWGSPLSNWFLYDFEVKGVKFISMEQYMMYRKAKLFGDKVQMKKILKERSNEKIKLLGRAVKPFDQKTWDDNKLKIVRNGLYHKFTSSSRMKHFLMETGDRILVEGAPKDDIWGVALHWTDPKILDKKNWRGQNLLGKCLMRVRKRIREEDDEE